MKYLYAFLLITFCSSKSSAQVKEKAEFKKIPAEFQSLFNQANYNNIYSLFTPAFRQNISEISLKIKLSDLKKYAGNIKSYQFASVKDSIAYSLELENGSTLKILITEELKINQLVLNRKINPERIIGSENLYSEPLALYKGKKTSPENTIALSKFINLVLPQDDGQLTGRIVVKIEVDKSGKILYANISAKGTTLVDKELYKKCEESLLNASLPPFTDGVDIHVFYIPFIFKVN